MVEMGYSGRDGLAPLASTTTNLVEKPLILIMKNLCFIIDSLSGGGAERVVLNLSKAISELGHHVHIIILEKKIIFS